MRKDGQEFLIVKGPTKLGLRRSGAELLGGGRKTILTVRPSSLR